MKIEILSRQQLMIRAENPFSDNTALISITDPDREDVVLKYLPKHILRLKFEDVGDEIYEEILGRIPTPREQRQIEEQYRMFSSIQSQMTADFLMQLGGKADTLICQCEYGQSRSAAVAAAILEYSRQKGISVFSDSRYYPNKLVFRKLLSALRTQGHQ